MALSVQAVQTKLQIPLLEHIRLLEDAMLLGVDSAAVVDAALDADEDPGPQGWNT